MAIPTITSRTRPTVINLRSRHRLIHRVEAYVAAARRETEIERLSTDREKTGVPLGADAMARELLAQGPTK